MFIWNESYLILIGIKYAVELLISCTLFRKNKEKTPITKDEKERIKKYYNIDLDEMEG